MQKVFIYWDNSNIFIGAREMTEKKEGKDAYFRMRVKFSNVLRLAQAGRDIEKAVVAGSVTPQLESVWRRIREEQGVAARVLERGSRSDTEQGVDQVLQVQMLRDLADYSEDPGIVVLLTGDGNGFYNGIGFHADIERMYRNGWRIEVLSWSHSCNPRMRRWVEEHGLFIPLDDFYTSITYLEQSGPDHPPGEARHDTPLMLSQRPRLN